MTALNPRRIVLTLAGPVLALLVAFVVTSLVLVAVGDPVGDVWSTLLAKPLPRQMVNIVNAASVFYISAIAVAIGLLAKASLAAANCPVVCLNSPPISVSAITGSICL